MELQNQDYYPDLDNWPRNKMTNEEVFNKIKDKFSGVKMLGASTIALLTTDGERYEVDQSVWDKEYEIRFYCNHDGGDCGSCDEHGTEKWEVLKR